MLKIPFKIVLTAPWSCKICHEVKRENTEKQLLKFRVFQLKNLDIKENTFYLVLLCLKGGLKNLKNNRSFKAGGHLLYLGLREA